MSHTLCSMLLLKIDFLSICMFHAGTTWQVIFETLHAILREYVLCQIIIMEHDHFNKLQMYWVVRLYLHSLADD